MTKCFVRCSRCGKQASNIVESPIPEGIVVRAFVECPECIERQLQLSKPRTFTMYRRGDLSLTHNEKQVNPPNEPQFEGVVFSDGKVVIRWLTTCRSVSVWDSFEDMMAIHGHPEYDSEIVWGNI